MAIRLTLLFKTAAIASKVGWAAGNKIHTDIVTMTGRHRAGSISHFQADLTLRVERNDPVIVW